jgi:hypothetical protein
MRSNKDNPLTEEELKNVFRNEFYTINDERYFPKGERTERISRITNNETGGESIIMEEIETKVKRFISRFVTKGESENVFSNGCCYWFAYILFERFKTDADVEIVYNCVDNHFATKVDGVIYDVTGEIDATNWVSWDDYADDLHKERIIRDCVNF